MRLAPLVFLIGLGYSAGSTAQEAAGYLGAADCRIAPVKPAPEGEVEWSGKCKDGYAEGQGVVAWRAHNGTKYKLEATLARGQVQGEATRKTSEGNTYTGTFKDGLPDGKGYFRTADGFQYEGEYHNGKREGVAEGLFPNGDNYQGQWKDGKPDGVGRMTYMIGGAYEGEWKAGKREGRGTVTWAGSGRRQEVQYTDNRLLGTARPDTTTRYSLKAAEAHTGTNLKKDIAYNSVVPVDVGYDALTPEQKRALNVYYPALEEGDEPPYPLRGPKEFYTLMSKVAGRLGSADLNIYVLVGADGKAQSVTVMGTDDPEIRRIAGLGAGVVQYKPAMCQGKPCEMKFQYRLALRQLR